jgi:hypothetical protein
MSLLRGALLCLSCAGVEQPPPIECLALTTDDVALDVRSCGQVVRVYVENTGDDAATVTLAHSTALESGSTPTARLDPGYGETIELTGIRGSPISLSPVVARAPSEVVWSDVDVVWDEPAPHGAGVEVRTRRCDVSEGELRCELGVRNFGAKAVDVSLRAIVDGDSLSAGRERVYPGDAIVMIAAGNARGQEIEVHGVVRAPVKR